MISMLDEYRAFESRKKCQLVANKEVAPHQDIEKREQRIKLIKENAGKLCNRELAESVGMNISNLRMFCSRHGIELPYEKVPRKERDP